MNILNSLRKEAVCSVPAEVVMILEAGDAGVMHLQFCRDNSKMQNTLGFVSDTVHWRICNKHYPQIIQHLIKLSK